MVAYAEPSAKVSRVLRAVVSSMSSLCCQSVLGVRSRVLSPVGILKDVFRCVLYSSSPAPP